MLVQHNGHAIKKDNLIELVWPDAVVEENNLNQYVWALRKALDDGEGSTYIETVRKYGYRFVGDVRETTDETSRMFVYRNSRTRMLVREEKVEEATAMPDPLVVSRRNPRAWRLIGAAIAVALVAVLAAAVTRALYAPTVKPAEVGTLNLDPAVYDGYQAGRAAWNKRTSAGLFESVERYEKAIEKDPRFALAYVGIADSYAFDIGNWKKAEALAMKAIEIDPRLAEPHATIGFIRTFWEWKGEEGEREFKQAIKLNPNYATAHQWYAIHLAVSGRPVEAEVEMSRALRLEPQSPVMLADMGQVLYFNRKYDDAVGLCEKALSIDSTFINAHQYLADIYMAKGLPEKALQEFVMVKKTEGTSAFPLDGNKLRKAIRSGGLRGFWKAMLVERPDQYEMARYYARLGQKEKTIQGLEKALGKRDFRIVFASADPIFDEFRGEPEFALLIKHIGVAK